LQQGDPLGPFLFALALHSVVKASDTKLKEVALKSKSAAWSAWYLDDGHLFGPIDALAAAFEVILHTIQELDLGLELSTAKTRLWGAALQPTDGAPPRMPPEIPQDSALRKITLVPYATGIRVLGIPVVANPQEKATIVTAEFNHITKSLKADRAVVQALLSDDGAATNCPAHRAGTKLIEVLRRYGPQRAQHLLRGVDCAAYTEELAALEDVLSRPSRPTEGSLVELRIAARLAAILNYQQRAPKLNLPIQAQTPPSDYRRLLQCIAADSLPPDLHLKARKQRRLQRWLTQRRLHPPRPTPTPPSPTVLRSVQPKLLPTSESDTIPLITPKIPASISFLTPSPRPPSIAAPTSSPRPPLPPPASAPPPPSRPPPSALTPPPRFPLIALYNLFQSLSQYYRTYFHRRPK